MRYRIFPFPTKLNHKWWHRLGKVLIFLFSIFALLLGILFAKVSIDETQTSRSVYNFERGYLSFPGRESELNRYNATYDFIERLLAASKDRADIAREFIPPEETTTFISSMRNPVGNPARLDYEVRDIILDALKRKDPEIQEWKIKTLYEYQYFPGIFWILIGPICYLFLIGIYAVILYIIFGSNPFKSN